MIPPLRQRRPAYNLPEVLMATALVGVVMVASLNTLGGATGAWVATSRSHEAETLAHEMMAEVLSHAYSDPDTTDDPDLENWGLEPGEIPADRTTWDDLDDYDDLTSAPPKQRNGANRAGYAGWTRSVNVQKLKKDKVDDFHNDGDRDRGNRLVTVTVTDPDGQTTTLTTIRCRGGALEQPIGVDTTLIESLTVSLTAGMDSILTTARLANHAEAP